MPGEYFPIIFAMKEVTEGRRKVTVRTVVDHDYPPLASPYKASQVALRILGDVLTASSTQKPETFVAAVASYRDNLSIGGQKPEVISLKGRIARCHFIAHGNQL